MTLEQIIEQARVHQETAVSVVIESILIDITQEHQISLDELCAEATLPANEWNRLNLCVERLTKIIDAPVVIIIQSLALYCLTKLALQYLTRSEKNV